MGAFFQVIINIVPEISVVFVVLVNFTNVLIPETLPFLVSYLAGVYWYYFLGLYIFNRQEWLAVASQTDVILNEGSSAQQQDFHAEGVFSQHRPEYLLIFITILCGFGVGAYVYNDPNSAIEQVLTQNTWFLVMLYSIYAIVRNLVMRHTVFTMSPKKRLFEIKMLQTHGLVQIVGTFASIFAVLLAADLGPESAFLPAYVIVPVFSYFVAVDIYRQYTEHRM